MAERDADAPVGASDNPASRKLPMFLAFDCPSCGHSVVALCGDPRMEPRCHRCRMSPGWHRSPEIVASYEVDAALIAAGEAAALTCEVA